MNNPVPPTLAEAIMGETLLRYGDIYGARKLAADEMGISEALLSTWLTRPTIPRADQLVAVQKYLKLESFYDLGPMVASTMLERAIRSGVLRKRPK